MAISIPKSANKKHARQIAATHQAALQQRQQQQLERQTGARALRLDMELSEIATVVGAVRLQWPHEGNGIPILVLEWIVMYLYFI